MFTSSVPASPKVYTRTYSKFRGVDFTSAITEVDYARSPDALNMITDQDGFPQKRPGWAIVEEGFGDRINGVFKFVDQHNVERMVVHAGDSIWCFVETEPVIQPVPPMAFAFIEVLPEDSVPTKVYTGVKNGKSNAFVINNALYILDGTKYVKVYYDDGTDTVECSQVTGHIPTTQIAAPPAGGGEGYEPINLLAKGRINLFASDGTSTEYQLDATGLDAGSCRVWYLDGTGLWIEMLTGWTFDRTAGTVTFSTAPSVSPITGEDNIKIQFEKTIQSNELMIQSCTFGTFYGSGNDTRIFVSGNENYRNRDWYSEMNDPTYFPDINYSDIGADNSAIMGYLKQYSDLVIVKQQNDQDATLYLRSISTDGDGNLIFPVQQGLAGVGAISQHCFATLYDDNVFLSKDGVFGLDTSRITLQKTTQNRSRHVNAKLKKETPLEEAVACVWNGFYCLFINNVVYLADSKQRSANDSSSFGYEWFYWDNVPARVAIEMSGRLYFGTNDGKVCVFKDPAIYGMDAYSDNGEPIDSYWTTKLDDLDDPTTMKTIKKRNIGVVAMPLAKSSAEIYYLKDGTEVKATEYDLSSEFTFDFVDFDNIKFGIPSVPTFVPCNKKSKKSKMFRMMIKNNKVNEAFGIYKICFNYEYSKIIKHI